MDIAVLFRVLLNRKWILILIPLIAAVLAYIVMSFTPEEYRSKAQISTGFTINNDIALTDGGFNAREAEVKFGNLMETLKSPLMIGMLSYNLALHDITSERPFKKVDPETLAKLKHSNDAFIGDLTKKEIVEILNSKIDSLKLLTSYDEDEKLLLQLVGLYGYTYESILDNLNINRANFSDYVNIEYISHHPELSAFATNTLIEELIRYYNYMGAERSDKSLEYYEKLVVQKREELAEKSDALKTFKATNQVLNFDAENESNVSQIAALETKAQEEERNVYRLRLAIQNLNRRLNDAGSGGGAGSTNALLIQVREKIGALSQKLRETGDQSIQNQIDSLRTVQINLSSASSSLSVDGQAYTRQDIVEERESLKIELAVAERSLAGIQSTLNLLKGNASGLASKEATISNLQREVDLASEEYLEAQEKYNTAKNFSQGSVNSIRPVLYGQPAVNPESTKTLVITALAWALSFTFCVVAIVFLEFVDVSIKTVPQLENLTKLPVIGSVNYIDPKNNDLSLVFSNSNDHEHQEIEIFKHLLRKLRYEIESHKKKIILVTSTKQGEGKSFLILSLAYSLSLIQKKILIIDTNFKNNSLTQILLAKPKFEKLLEASNERYKQKLLVFPEGDKFEDTEERKDNNYKKTIISPTYLKNIDIIGSRGGDDSPAEILSGRNFKEALEELSSEYDYIFLEGASINDYSDTKELVEFSDIVLPVFSAESVIKQMDKESIAYLKRLDGKLMGTVLNKINKDDLNL